MAKTETLIILWVFIYLSSQVFSQLDELFYNGFNDAGDKISLNGVAEIESNGILRLTNYTNGAVGRAFYSSEIKFKNSSAAKSFSFSTAFAFAIFSQYPKVGGHGFAFTVSPQKELSGALPSQFLGLLNQTDIGNFSNHIFAVEFDTVRSYEFGDINGNHIGIDINSLKSKKSVPAAYFLDNSTKQELNLKSGKVIQAWIDYDGIKNRLDVRLSPSSTKPGSPILSFDVDLSPILKDSMYIGFSSSTGLLAASHYILGWSFKMNGEAKSLSLSSLPSLPGPKKNHTALKLGFTVSACVVIIFVVALSFFLVKKIKNADVVEEWEFQVGPHRYSYKELNKATRGFRDKQLLGFGGSGKVYKGTLPNSMTQIAVKRFSNESKQGLREFVSEIETIGRLRHRNLVQLLGWCRRRGDLLLVYDFMPNGSLDKFLFDEHKFVLTWEQRFNIVKGVASGLLYLHEEWEQTVIHRDIKAGNVLLDGDLTGKLGDFGLAKLYDRGSNPTTTRVVGTLGYLAPELTRTGKPTTSSDVFAFGALLLEVVCGRRPIEPKALPEELILVDWVWDRWNVGAILEVVDTRLTGEFDELEVLLVLKLGLMCSNNASEARPSMRQVVRYLEGEVALPEVVAPPDAYDVKKSNNNGSSCESGNSSGAGGECEDYVHSYPVYNVWRSIESLKDVDVETGLASSSPLPNRCDDGL